ncbi:hypothetical protein INS49_005386 [Diaporthe citri]|uniref:uncharacterized protein n=1 Tax=Diaporthe citri TaxID=83186 RepID=UPI001C7F9F38|nr:uncharacterized protein INS49_005386 [Diaporthe citri]KAG6353677.1 hypothetical protein INS49_005386 [Diaporthe citri]
MENPTSLNWDEASDGTSSDGTYTDLADLLLVSRSENLDFVSFWSFDTLCKVLTRDRVMQELRSCKNIFKNEDELESYVDRVGPVYGKIEDIPNSVNPCKPSSEPKRCLKVLAILILMEKVRSIKQFIDEGIHDGDLPLELRRTDECFRRWNILQLYSFNRYQFEVNAPFFDYHPGKDVCGLFLEPRMDACDKFV